MKTNQRDNRSSELNRGRFRRKLKDQWELYVASLIPLTLLAIFNYTPMAYVTMAFQKYSIKKGLFRSKWIGFENFERFFSNPNFKRILVNTLRIGGYGFIAGTLVSIFLAFAINEIRRRPVKKFVQLVTYAPYFISVTVVVGIIQRLFDYNVGIINKVIVMVGGAKQNVLGDAGAFTDLFVWSGVWMGAGFGSIIYISALTSIDPQLFEAATIDGATRLQQVRYIDIPQIMPTIAVLLILNLPSVINVPYDRIYLMQNGPNTSTSEVIMSYIYKSAIQNGEYSYSAAVGLFNSVISLALVLGANFVARHIDEHSALF